MSDEISAAIEAFSKGLPVCLFDSEKREGETDLLFSGQYAQPSTMRQLRQECGGLLFLAIGDEVGELSRSFENMRVSLKEYIAKMMLIPLQLSVELVVEHSLPRQDFQ